MVKPTWDEYFLNIAEAVSKRSSCVRRKVGAVLVHPNNRIAATGYNDAPEGKPGCEGCPRSNPANTASVAANAPYDAGGAGECGAIHAEQNILLDFPRQAMPGCTLYITEEPCPWCRKLIGATDISRVVTPTLQILFDVPIKYHLDVKEVPEDARVEVEPERSPHDVAADIFNGGDE
jgi:dCMP deaminase